MCAIADSLEGLGEHGRRERLRELVEAVVDKFPALALDTVVCLAALLAALCTAKEDDEQRGLARM